VRGIAAGDYIVKPSATSNRSATTGEAVAFPFGN